MTDDDLRTAPVFYLRDAAQRRAGDVAELDGDESRHVRALRLAPGDPVRLTDARGVLWGARLEADGEAVRLAGRLDPPSPLEVDLWAPVGNKQATLWLVEKATEFGLRRLRPVECVRSASVADAGRSKGFWSKAGRRALAAAKQSGSAWSPEIDRPATLEDRLAKLDGSGPRVVLDPAGPPLARVLRDWPGVPAVVVLAGPEGGLTEDEKAACGAAGFRSAALAATVLRFETAAVTALAVAAQRQMAAKGERHADSDNHTEGKDE